MTAETEHRVRNVVLLVLLPFIALGFCWLATDKLATIQKGVDEIPALKTEIATLRTELSLRQNETDRRLAGLDRSIDQLDHSVDELQKAAITFRFPQKKGASP